MKSERPLPQWLYSRDGVVLRRGTSVFSRDGVVLRRGTSVRSLTPEAGGLRSTTPEPGGEIAHPGKWVSGLRHFASKNIVLDKMKWTVIPAKAGIQIIATALTLAIYTHSTLAARIGPPLDYERPAFRLSQGDSTILKIPFRFIPHEGTSQTPLFMRGKRAVGGSFLASDWRIARPDRNDRFSVRWRGFWAPGEIECEIRLVADEAAAFYLDGKKALDCVAGATLSVGTFSLDFRAHELRVDYREQTGEAFVGLEWRTGETGWKPLVASRGGKKQSGVGWNADYYLGESFQSKSFSRVDPQIDFDWRLEGPFDRSEDVGTLTWKVRNDEGGRTAGEISANRDGTLALGLVLAPGAATRNVSLSFSNPLLEFSGAQPGGDTISIQFDREASDFSIGAATRTEEGLEAGTIEFSLRADDTIRFWELGGDVATGAQVAGALLISENEYETTRPRLGGEWSPWDERTIENGAWRLQVLQDGSFAPTDYGDRIGRLARLVAPDLILNERGAPVASVKDKGIREALEGLSSIETRMRETTKGRLDLLFDGALESGYRFDNYPLGENRLNIQADANRIRIENRAGTFIAFDSSGTVKNFQIDGAGNWTGDAALNRPSTLRAGPVERVAGVLWNGIPLLLVREGNRFQARIPSARGSFRLLLKKENPEAR